MSGVSNPYRYQYETVAVSQTGQVLGGTGAKGDYLHRLIINTITVSVWVTGITRSITIGICLILVYRRRAVINIVSNSINITV